MELVQAYKFSMRRLASTVSVVTCCRGGRRFGIAATSITSLSAEPPSILLCVNRNASISEPLIDVRRFCVNILRADQIDIAASFGGERQGEERFAVGAWRTDEQQTPYLEDAQANLLCELSEIIEYHTHNILIGKVLDTHAISDISPLVYQDGSYASTRVTNTIIEAH